MNSYSKEPREGSGKPKSENTCSYCLYFQPPWSNRRPLRGNCTRHKQWIERASLTTCSEMSSKTLIPKGIYRMVPDRFGKRVYVFREVPMRTRLFLVPKIAGGRGEMPYKCSLSDSK